MGQFYPSKNDQASRTREAAAVRASTFAENLSHGNLDITVQDSLKFWLHNSEQIREHRTQFCKICLLP